eukprot:CAMPEP_0174695776 /NCGR_PEP_ID=MMETSP1094-20130205/2070_1 /TAXON_ID=156173 /ORGANISM="Chrysochromulina brevifilum, Strain UTEX LB 985" /LENGTH=92 /DNA_ID=CAMNT_0015892353 /DNA_START=62 /DNA_END=340 /DNA_ORIENTATION=+
MAAMQPGEIKFFQADKNYGFILPDDGSGDVFFHYRAWGNADPSRLLAAGDRVEFEFEFSDGKRKAPRIFTLDGGSGPPLRRQESRGVLLLCC